MLDMEPRRRLVRTSYLVFTNKSCTFSGLSFFFGTYNIGFIRLISCDIVGYQ